nr:MAG TPA: hypothetical protein [Caudoviricetes sp.]
MDCCLPGVSGSAPECVTKYPGDRKSPWCSSIQIFRYVFCSSSHLWPQPGPLVLMAVSSPCEWDRFGYNPQVTHVCYINQVFLRRENLYGIPVLIADCVFNFLQCVPRDAVFPAATAAHAGGVNGQPDNAVRFLKFLHKKVGVNPYLAAFRVIHLDGPAFFRHLLECSDHDFIPHSLPRFSASAWQSAHIRQPGIARRRASSISSPHSSQ